MGAGHRQLRADRPAIGDLMAEWSLLISLLALVVSAGSLYYTRRAAARDTERQHQERTPDLAVRAVPARGAAVCQG